MTAGPAAASPAIAPERRSDLGGTATLLLIYLASRLIVAVATASVASLNPSGARCGESVSTRIEGYAGLARCWDTEWYLRVVTDGYPHGLPADGGPTTLAFFPGYPALIAVGRGVGLSPLVAALLVSLVAGAVATVLVERMAQHVTAPEAARRAAILFALFPGAVVFSWGYTEALAAALAGVCLLALNKGRWWLAGVGGALAGTVRADVGLALTVAGLVAAVVAVRRRGEWRAVTTVVLAPLGVLGYLLFVWLWTGSPTTWSQTQSEGWDQHMDWGRHALVSLGGVLKPWASPSRAVLVLAVLMLAVGVIALVRYRMPASWTAYVVVLVGVALVSSQVGFRPRAEVLLLPAFVAAGIWVPPRLVPWIVPALATAQALLTVLWLGAPLIAPP